MIIEKVIQTCVSLDELALTGNIDIVLLDTLKGRFKNKCYRSSYILDVLEIIRKSDSVISRTVQDSSCVINVMFKVKALVIRENDVLHNCVVRKIDDRGNILCQNEYSSIYIKENPVLQNIKRGQIIVALAKIVSYRLFKSEMSIKAVPFIPTPSKNAVILKVVVSKKTPLYDEKLIELKNEEKILKEHAPSVISFFQELLYPYKTSSRLNMLKKNGSLVDLTDTKFKVGDVKYLLNDDSITKDKPYIISCNVNLEDPLKKKELQIDNHRLVIDEPYDLIMSTLIQFRIEYIKELSKFASQYYTDDIIKKNDVLWNTYRKYKRS